MVKAADAVETFADIPTAVLVTHRFQREQNDTGQRFQFEPLPIFYASRQHGRHKTISGNSGTFAEWYFFRNMPGHIRQRQAGGTEYL